jgi:general secretion pathway protein A
MNNDPIQLDSNLALERLGMHEDPFSMASSPRYFYLGPEHLSVYRQIEATILRRRGLGLVSGVKGTGKTSLAKMVFDQFFGKDNIDIASIPTPDFHSRLKVAQAITRAFPGLNLPNARTYEDEMENFKKAAAIKYEKGRTIVLLMDDAQLLTRQGMVLLHHLYNFDFSEKVVNVILFGNESTPATLGKYGDLYARLFFNLTLAPLSFTNAIQMVNFRMMVAGRNRPLFDDDAFSLLYQVSDGIPRVIVMLCAKATDYLLLNTGDVVTLEMMREVVRIHADETTREDENTAKSE